MKQVGLTVAASTLSTARMALPSAGHTSSCLIPRRTSEARPVMVPIVQKRKLRPRPWSEVTSPAGAGAAACLWPPCPAGARAGSPRGQAWSPCLRPAPGPAGGSRASGRAGRLPQPDRKHLHRPLSPGRLDSGPTTDSSRGVCGWALARAPPRPGPCRGTAVWPWPEVSVLPQLQSSLCVGHGHLPRHAVSSSVALA